MCVSLILKENTIESSNSKNASSFDTKRLNNLKKIILRDNLFSQFKGLLNKDSQIINSLLKVFFVENPSFQFFCTLWKTLIKTDTSISPVFNQILREIEQDDLENIFNSCKNLLHDKNVITKAYNKLEQQQFIADKGQQDNSSRRTFEQLSKVGMVISVSEDKLPYLIERFSNYNGPVPILEIIKNEKILNLSGYKNSKVGLATHDFFDHIIFTSVLKDYKLLSKYDDFWKEIGDPKNTDLLARSGERIASIAFQIRKLMFIDLTKYSPRLNAGVENLSKLTNILENGKLKFPVHATDFEEVIKLIKDNKNDLMVKKVEFVLNEVLAEFVRENQANGNLKRLNYDNSIAGEADFFDPRYLCFIIESCVCICDEEKIKNLQNILFKLDCFVESFLRNSISHSKPIAWNMNLESITNFVPEDNLDEATVAWIKNHLGFTTFKNKTH